MTDETFIKESCTNYQEYILIIVECAYETKNLRFMVRGDEKAIEWGKDFHRLLNTDEVMSVAVYNSTGDKRMWGSK